MNQRKNALLIAYYYPPCGMGGVQRAVKLTKYLPQFGWDVTVLTVRDIMYYQKDNSLLDDIPGSDIQRTGSLDPLRLAYIFTHKKNRGLSQGNNSFLSKRTSLFQKLYRFIDRYVCIPDSKILWFPFAVYRGIRIIKQKNIQAIISTAPPFSTHIIALCLSKIGNIPWIADFRDGWTNSHLYTPKGIYYTINTFLEKMVLKNARKVTCYGEPLVSYFSVKQYVKKCICLYNGFDEEDFTDFSRNESDHFIITYMGTISKWTDPSIFFPAITKAVNSDREFKNKLKIEIIGNIMDSHCVKSREWTPLASHISYIGYLPHKDALKRLSASQMLLFPITNDPEGCVVTSKVFEYIASGVPIMAHIPSDEVRSIVSGYCNEYFLLKDDNNNAKEYILKLYYRWRKLQKNGFNRDNMGLANHFKSIQIYSRKHQAQMVAVVLDEITAKSEGK